MKEHIEKRVKQITADILRLEVEEIDMDAHINHDLGADSLDAIQICMALEEEFDCHISDEVGEWLTTPQAAVDWLEENGNPECTNP